ncbi:RagB/SusD family nutrient uptake outer membrane protein [Halosquirtibacter laminarini]|uniref:RagB/SusD family nutrient uptake outer membrane protein n=1 Tax=Halosquirtibacter laminarini TaxID=3374600 RepID=A0AC61NM10_9BACT|nr:RagB/SusD family nutrient uptake outer membrane protein [Prolixibacteraceae bacterium]
MKYTINIISVALLLLISSCKDYLDIVPDNLATIDNAFQTKYDAQRFLYTCYSFLPRSGQVNEDPALLCGDEVWMNDLVTQRGNQVARGYLSAINPEYNFWDGVNGGKGLFVAIRDCHIFYDKIGMVEELSSKERDEWIAEVKFLEAYYNWYLVRMYGPIPIIDDNHPVGIDLKETYVKRQNVDKCFAHIVSLIDEAIQKLPSIRRNEGEEYGRITKSIALAIKARILTTYASPLFNGNIDYTELQNKDGEKLFPSSYDETRWEVAATACKAAIDECEAASLRLYNMGDYISKYPLSDFTMRKMMMRNIIMDNANPEFIWGNTLSNVNDLQNQASPKFFSVQNYWMSNRYSVTMRIVDQFYSKNGVPISEDIDYEYSTRFDLTDVDASDYLFSKPNATTAKINLNRENRFYSTLGFNRGNWFGNGKTTDDTDTWYIEGMLGEASSVSNASAYNTTGYWAKKLISPENELNTDGSYTRTRYAFPIMRMADLYLLYAETLNESSGPSAEVYKYIDMIRSRAGLEGVVESWGKYSKIPSKPTTKTGLREIVHQEREIELALEGRRFWDLRRWKECESLMNNKVIKGWNVLSPNGDEGYYTLTNLYQQSFTIKDYFWPIREGNLNINPNLVQNIGWKN